ncbi:MAG: 50S ribosomal protein L10 [Acidobacteriota bacterium]|nr:50S ribosomal protein L10 [Acidobacteriota bacterium]
MTSPKSIERNQKRIEELAGIFARRGVYLFDYRGLSVPELQELRSKVKNLNAGIKVFKNRMAIKYFAGAGHDQYGRDLFQGPLAVAYADDNFIEVAKVMVEYEKESKKIQLKSAFVESRLMDREKVLQLAKLPGRDQLLAQLAMSIVHPLKKMGMSLAAPLTNMLILLKNLQDKKAKQGEE